ncbi:MAG: NAD(P)/FAD-dependent oxidoreductase [Thermodesulfobacteriota bacterium]
MKSNELVIIGGGAGGLAAAIEAAKLGVETTVIDENVKPGGQIYRQLEEGFQIHSLRALGRDYTRGSRLLNEFDVIRSKIKYLNNTVVWGLFPENELVYQHSGRSESLRYRKLIIASGAYDRPVAFPGWTLPGVLTAGGAQRLVKTQRVLPGEMILLAGTGPLQLVLANQIINAGGNIVAVLEAGTIIDSWFKLLRSLWGQWDLLMDGLSYIFNIRKAKVPLLLNHIILEAHGEEEVKEAVVARVDKDWRPIPGTERTLDVDTICIGYGLVPSAEITQLGKCEHQYSPRLGGWVPKRQENLETSVPGIYAIGDGSGVEGSKAAIAEGRIAGIDAAHTLGYLSASDSRKRKEPFEKQLKKYRRFRKVMDKISEPRPGLFELAKEDTIICRCEEITLGDVDEAIARGGREINEIKRMTRAGMGRCQGRMCGPFLVERIRRTVGLQEIPGPGHLNPRPPLKPIKLGSMTTVD